MKYILVGERHGIVECPEAFWEIVKKHNIKQVALEFQKSKQKEVDNYLSSAIPLYQISIFREIEDGRTSKAMKKLFSRLKKNNIKIYFVDSDHEGDPLERDYYMAKNLQSIEGDVAFLCGEVHASKEIITLSKNMIFFNKIMNVFGRGFIAPQDRRIRPCASYLSSQDVLSYRIVPKQRSCSSCISGHGEKVVVSEEKGFDYYYLVDRFTPSD